MCLLLLRIAAYLPRDTHRRISQRCCFCLAYPEWSQCLLTMLSLTLHVNSTNLHTLASPLPDTPSRAHPILLRFRHLHRPTGTILQPRRQNLHPSLRNEQSMLKLRRLLSILGNTRPIIRPSLLPMRSKRNHRLNSENHTWLRLSHSFILRIMRNVRCAVKELMDSMSTVCFHHCAVVGFGYALDGVAKGAE